MSDFDFDELLDQALHNRAHSELPTSLKVDIAAMLSREQNRTLRRIWWQVALAACLLLGVLVCYRSYVGKSMPAQTAAQVAPSAAGAPPGPPQSEESFAMNKSGSILPASRDTTHLPPAALRAAKHTEACAMIPCSCPEMCRVSD